MTSGRVVKVSKKQARTLKNLLQRKQAHDDTIQMLSLASKDLHENYWHKLAAIAEVDVEKVRLRYDTGKRRIIVGEAL